MAPTLFTLPFNLFLGLGDMATPSSTGIVTFSIICFDGTNIAFAFPTFTELPL